MYNIGIMTCKKVYGKMTLWSSLIIGVQKCVQSQWTYWCTVVDVYNEKKLDTASFTFNVVKALKLVLTPERSSFYIGRDVL